MSPILLLNMKAWFFFVSGGRAPCNNAQIKTPPYIDDSAVVLLVLARASTLVDGVLDLEDSFPGEGDDAVARLEVVEVPDRLRLHMQRAQPLVLMHVQLRLSISIDLT